MNAQAAVLVACFVAALSAACATPQQQAPGHGPIRFTGETRLQSNPRDFAMARGAAAALGAQGCSGPISIHGAVIGFTVNQVVEQWIVEGCGKRKELRVGSTPGKAGFEMVEAKPR